MTDNSSTMIGRLTNDPELKFTNSGKAVARFSLAVDRRWLNKITQEWESQASFFTCVAWDKLAENIASSLKKGYRVIATGMFEQRSWETDSGEKRSTVELVVDGIGPDLRFVTCELHKSASEPRQSSAPEYDDDPF